MPYTDEKGNLCLTNRECALSYMPEIPKIEAENEKLKSQNSKLRTEIDTLNVKLTKAEAQVSTYESKGKEWIKKVDERFKKEKAELEKIFNLKLSELSRKAESEKKELVHRCTKLSKQVYDFEKIVITERDIFDKETKNYEKKNTLLFKEISDKNQNLEKDFEAERKHFESVISELSEKLALASDTPVLSPYDGDASESVCSFQSVDSLHQKMVCKKQTVKSEVLKSNQIKPSCPFYVKSVDIYAYGFNDSKKEKMIWVVKGSPESVKYQKSIAEAELKKKNIT
ncbi:hypothetical protein L6452_02293 [Arctium lappa]|uniref:Uncharacterized protein n=1 Tax=Arctium lappa TaxID=4217 RepID=A0ACB9FJ08_ARCLA|nr:hypothetical protein L6452_02293 [Arctium lappa]